MKFTVPGKAASSILGAVAASDPGDSESRHLLAAGGSNHKEPVSVVSDSDYASGQYRSFRGGNNRDYASFYDSSLETDLDSLASERSSDDTGIGILGRGASFMADCLEHRTDVTLSWENINVYASDQNNGGGGDHLRRPSCTKHIIKDVSGTVRPGELLAIMGASGAGKTTLLNALTFRTKSSTTVSGVIRLNGMAAGAGSLTALSAYVTQHDLFLPNLTVREHLQFQATVRIGSAAMSSDMKMARVEEVIAELGLVKCGNTLIGVVGGNYGISGGERRRLAFASEVLTNPAVLFCDEPTSGLDSYMAGTVVGVLRSMASRGRTILATIHQPSSLVYSLFDRVMFLAEGRVGFLGNSDAALAFFSDLGYPCPENHNPADFLIQTLAVRPGDEENSRARIRKICDAFSRAHDVIAKSTGFRRGRTADANVVLEDDPKSMARQSGSKKLLSRRMINDGSVDIEEDDGPAKKPAIVANLSPYRVPWTIQCKALLWRSWLTMIREPIIIKVRVLETITVALIQGLMFYDQKLTKDGIMNISGALFLLVANMTFQNAFAVVSVFCSEYPIFLKEHEAGMYRVPVYFGCKSLAELPLFIVSPLIFTSCVYFLIGLTAGVKNFLTTCGVTVLVANAACSFGYMISCISSNMHMGLAVGPAVIVPFMLLGGYYLNNGSVPKALLWLKYLSWFLYGNEALAINQWSNVGHIDCGPASGTKLLSEDVMGANATKTSTVSPFPTTVHPDANSCPKDGMAVLYSFSFNPDNIGTDILSLLALIVGFRLVGLVALVLRTRKSSSPRI